MLTEEEQRARIEREPERSLDVFEATRVDLDDHAPRQRATARRCEIGKGLFAAVVVEIPRAQRARSISGTWSAGLAQRSRFMA